MSVLGRIRGRIWRAPSRYERLWLRTVNAVGVAVVLAVLFDLEVVLGSGETGVYRRALYPLVPPGLVLGVALADRDRRQAAVAAGLVGGYLLLLTAVGTLGRALAAAPEYPAAGVAVLAVFVGAGYLTAGRW